MTGLIHATQGATDSAIACIRNALVTIRFFRGGGRCLGSLAAGHSYALWAYYPYELMDPIAQPDC